MANILLETAYVKQQNVNLRVQREILPHLSTALLITDSIQIETHFKSQYIPFKVLCACKKHPSCVGD
jgi:hypothetical protein